MADLDDHPAWQVPPANGSAFCSCVFIDEAECPTVDMEGKVGAGAFSRPAPCFFFNEVDEEYYLTRRREVFKAVREVASPPHNYNCELWFDGVSNVYIKSNESLVDTPYDSLVVTSYIENADGECEGPTTTTTGSEYSRRQYINSRHGSDDTCGGADIPGERPPGGFLDELDPDNSTDVTTYEDLYTPLGDGEIKARAASAMEDDFAAAGWGGSLFATRSISADGDGIVTADAIKAATRFHVTGGNTGYVRIEWDIINELSVVVDSGSAVRTWDPTTTLDDYIDGPLLDAPWPPDTGGTTSRELVLTGVFCLPEE